MLSARFNTPSSFLIGISVLAALLFGSAPAFAADCPTSVSVNPNPVWQGGPITVTGTGWPVGTSIFINLDGKQLGSTTTNASGEFSLSATISADSSLGSDILLFVQDGPADCEVHQKQEVLASQPVATTQPPPTTTTTTTSTTTTTTLSPTTTVPPTTAAPTTSAAPSTTLPPATVAATADSQPSTTADTEETGSDDRTSPVLVGLLGALIGAGVLGGGIALSRRQRAE